MHSKAFSINTPFSVVSLAPTILFCAVQHMLKLPAGSAFLPCIVCSCVGNCSNAFPNIVHWERKYKVGLHLAWFESRILREKCIIVTVSRD